jgi:hypothetical protein
MWIREAKKSDPGWKKFGSGMGKIGSGIRDEHPPDTDKNKNKRSHHEGRMV